MESLLEESQLRGEIGLAERLVGSATVLFAVQGEVALTGKRLVFVRVWTRARESLAVDDPRGSWPPWKGSIPVANGREMVVPKMG